ncbi:MAG: YkvA family protein [Geminicoccaceae bacterium]
MTRDLATLPTDFTPADEPRLWRKLVRVLAKIGFADSLLAAWYCAIDLKTPVQVRAILLGAVGYFVLPVDAIPDVLAGIGFTDDASVLMAAIAMVAHHITPEHRERARQRLDELIR